MKKMFIIILILLMILIGMYIYRQSQTNIQTVTVEEINKIELYLQKIYMWKEITEQALPEFDNINNANEIWLWEVVKKNLEDYELSYNQIQDKAKELFGPDFNKEFPKDGTEYLTYDSETDKYYAIGMGLDTEDDLYVLNTIEKIEGGYRVQIIEYLEDYSNSYNVEETENAEYDIPVKNINEETILTVKNTENETNIKEMVKENMDKFSQKEIILRTDSNGEIYVKSVKQI